MKTKEIIATENAPKAIGPYSQACKYNGMIFVSGQIPVDPETNEMVEADIAVQTNRSLTNIKNILEKAGSSMDDVLKVTVYLKNMSDFAKMNEVYGTFFKEGNYPARCAFEVVQLPKGALVEIDAIAIDQQA